MLPIPMLSETAKLANRVFAHAINEAAINAPALSLPAFIL
jgi:hypothetical protein